MTNPIQHNRNYRIYLYFLIILILCYGNSFQVPWALDDPPNITENLTLHIDNLQPETLWQTFFAQPFAEGTLYRPVANLSFAVNWYFGQDNPFGYHLVNFLLHVLTAIFLFKTLLILMRATSTARYSEQAIIFIAVLSATLWAINPVQSQAVTYIVQRMASMAAMFYIFALHSYLCARTSGEFPYRVKHLLLCGLFSLLALGCKENAVTLIPSLLLIELLFFKRSDRFSRVCFGLLVAATIIFLAAVIWYIASNNLLHYLNKPIGSRPFSLGERLLTQPSILLFYLSLLLYPSPARLSIDHSFPLSSHLLHPWTTLPAILSVAGIIFFAVWKGRKIPLFSFAILFYFINHLVESTIIPLEMIFEHRNYLPSFFLFLPVAAGLHVAINHFASTSRLVQTALIIMIPPLLIAIGLGTYIRNQVWTTEESLWADAIGKAPNNARPYAKLGEIYGWQKEKTSKNLNVAVSLLHQALDKESPRTSFKPAIVNNIGKVYANYGLLDQATVYYNQSLALNPDFINSRFDLANALTLQGKFPEALEQIDIVIQKNEQQSRFFSLKTLLLLWLDRPQEAAVCSYQAIRRTFVNKERYFYNTGVALTRAGHLSQGEWFLKRAHQNQPDDRRIFYSLLENQILARDAHGAQKTTLQLLDRQSITVIQEDMEALRVDYAAVPVNTKLIAPLIFETAQNIVSHLKPLALLEKVVVPAGIKPEFSFQKVNKPYL